MEGETIYEAKAATPRADTLARAGKHGKSASAAYEEPTPDKVAFGKRMKEAREIAGMSQAEAAEAMGYSQALQLSLMVPGRRIPTTRVLIHAATLYGTTMGYLCGLVDDSDRDPAAAAQPEVAATLERVRQLGGKLFADLPAGALLVRHMQATLGTANEHLAAVARAQRVASAAPADVLHLTGVDLPSDAADLAELAGRRTRPLQVAAVDDDEPNVDEFAPMTYTNEDAKSCPHNAA